MSTSKPTIIKDVKMYPLEILHWTIRTCIHLARFDRNTNKLKALSSGVIIDYKGRLFLCTVFHNMNYDNAILAIVTGQKKDNQTFHLLVGGREHFNLVSTISFEMEEEPDEEDIEYMLNHPESSGHKLDIAYMEVTNLPDVAKLKILQDEIRLDLSPYGNIHMPAGVKLYPSIEDNQQDVNCNAPCSFFGRIRPDLNDEICDFQEHIYWNLINTGRGSDEIELDLGEPVADAKRFKGCSGAPVWNTDGLIVGLVTRGVVTDTKIYAFPMKKLLMFIDATITSEKLAAN